MGERNYLPQFMERGKPFSVKTRKPPGGDTNDIFGLEKRQREMKLPIYEDKRMNIILTPDTKFQKNYYETDDIPSPRDNSGRRARRSLSECRTKSDDPFQRTPPIATGKENIGSHFKKCLSTELIINSKGKKLDETEDEEDDEISKSKQQELRNPITGDGLGNTTKLEDSTNITRDVSDEPVQTKIQRRPCIRVRQPPGGKSSIVF